MDVETRNALTLATARLCAARGLVSPEVQTAVTELLTERIELWHLAQQSRANGDAVVQARANCRNAEAHLYELIHQQSLPTVAVEPRLVLHTLQEESRV